jgi:hypothetical protein
VPGNALDELSGGGHLHAGRPPDGPDRDEQVRLDVVGNLTIADWMMAEIGGVRCCLSAGQRAVQGGS